MQRSIATRRTAVSLSVLITFVVVSLVMWRFTVQSVEQQKTIEFKAAAADTVAIVESRLDEYMDVLISTRGLYAASEYVDRAEFSAFVQALDLENRLPGIAAVEYVEHVHASELTEFEQAVQSDTTVESSGYPDFAVFPQSETPAESFVVNYIEPMEGNEAAFGFDLASNPERKDALIQARSTGKEVVSAPIQLLQDTDSGQTGFLVMLPVYANGADINTEQNRRQANEGFIIGVFRAGSLWNEILANTGSFDDLALSVEDVSVSGAGSEAVYSARQLSIDEQGLHVEHFIDMGGRTWRLTFFETDTFYSTQRSTVWLPYIVLIGGLLISLSMSSLLYAVMGTESKAVEIADERTKELNTQNKELRIAKDAADKAKMEAERATSMAEHSKNTLERVLHQTEQSRKDSEELTQHMVDRELKMVELKKEIEDLRKRLSDKG